MISIDERDYREALVGIGIDCRNEGTEASEDLLLLGTCGGELLIMSSTKISRVFHVLCCFVRWVGAELNPRNLVLGAGGPPEGAAGAALVGAGAAAGAGAGAAPPRPLVKATCGSVFVCVLQCGCLCDHSTLVCAGSWNEHADDTNGCSSHRDVSY